MSRWHQVIAELKQNNRLRHTLLLFAAVLAVCAFLGAGAGQAQAADSSPLYALTMVTGVTSGTNLEEKIGFIRVKYTAADGSGTHYEYLFPGNKDLQVSRELAESTGGIGNSKQIAQLKVQGYAAESHKGAFQAYSEDTIFFTPLREVSSFEGVEIYGIGSGEWNCQNLQIYQVDDGQMCLTDCGTVSDQYMIDFSGTLLLEMTKGKAFAWSNSTLFKVTTGGGDATMQTPSGEANRREMGGSDYIFRMDIADLYGAGIETLATADSATIFQQGYLEELALKVRYLDQAGCTREVSIPVISSTVLYAIQQGVSAGKIVGLAQQGETLVFGANLPGFASLESTELIYNYEEALSAAGLSTYKGQFINGQVENRRNNRLEELKNATEPDTLSLTGISLYDAADTTVTVENKDGFLSPTIEGTPLAYYRAERAEGTDFQYGSQTKVTYAAYEEGASILPVNDTERYLVVLKTDAPAAAGTTGSLRMTMRFQDLDGNQRETKTMVLSEQCRDYYGYWPGVSTDFAYLAGVQAGQELYVVVELSNVDYFNGIDLTLDSRDDDWQMSGVEIYVLDNLGARGAKNESVTVNGVTSDRRYFRTQELGKPILNISQTVLIQAGDTHTLDVRSDSTFVGDKDDDWSDIRYSMTYEQAKNLGSFIKTRQTYTVKVQVAGDVATDSENGDCGSDNQFYFQLVFEDGTSASVLANQQLSSDGFRTGTEETFTISTNQDYGELTAVRIIPDDLDSKSNVLDKLNVEKITVVKNSADAVSRQWVISNVGWIDINYRDEGAEAAGRKGRTMDELARTYSVSYSTDVVNLEIALATAPYALEDQQLKGEVTGVLTYRDVNGQTREQDIDVVRSMYDYMNQTPAAVSDPTYMFRDSHTDRFIVSVENPSEILSLKLYVNGSVQTTWNIDSVSVKLLGEDSSLQININDEYERVSDGETVSICEQDSTKTPAYSQICTPGTLQTINIGFRANSISLEDSGSKTTVSAISRTPRSSNDTLNIYVYMSEDADPLETYTIKAAARYTKVYGGVYQTSKALTAVEGEGSRVLYAEGLSASTMSTLNSLYLKAEPTGSSGIPVARVDYAIVQRVRSGVVVDTYYFDYGELDAYYGTSMRPEALPDSESEEQVVSLAFSADTSTLQLFAEKYDVAVSLRYKSSNDPSGKEAEYNSPYIFLTDQQCTSLKAGKIVDLTFNENYVGEVTGVTLTTSIQSNSRAVTGGSAEEIKIGVDSAVVATYQVQTGQAAYTDEETGQEIAADQSVRTCTGWYSFAAPITLSADEQTMERTSSAISGSGSVTQLTMKFVTAEAGENSDSGHSGPVSMTIGYTTKVGASRELYYADIRSYLTSGDFSAGSTAIARFQIEDLGEVRWIDITPKNEEGNVSGSWKLASMTGTLKIGDTETSFSRTLNRTFNGTDDGKINLNIQVNLTAATISSTGNVTTRKVSNDTASILAESGKPVTITVNVSGSDYGFNVSAEEYDVNTDAGKNVNNCLSIDGSIITFTAPTVAAGTSANYRVIVTSSEVPACKSVINITVQGAGGNGGSSGGNGNSGAGNDNNSNGNSDAGSTGSTGSSGSSGSTGSTTTTPTQGSDTDSTGGTTGGSTTDTGTGSTP